MKGHKYRLNARHQGATKMSMPVSRDPECGNKDDGHHFHTCVGRLARDFHTWFKCHAAATAEPEK
eukprot:3959804-Prymnesium_polylepis.1